MQSPVPEQPAPLQPVKREAPSAIALSLTCAPRVNEAEQVEPQRIPAGWLVTVPAPVPSLVTESRAALVLVIVQTTSAFVATVTLKGPLVSPSATIEPLPLASLQEMWLT